MDENCRQAIRELAERIEKVEDRHDTVLGEIRQSREERSRQIAKLDAKLDTLTHEVSEYRGALRFGKWLAGLLIAMGVPAALLAYWGGQRQ